MSPSSPVVRLPSVPSLTWDDCRLLVESVVDYAIFMLDAEGYVATWNRGAERIKGYRADEIVGQHFSRFYPPEEVERERPLQQLEKAARAGRVEDEGWRVRKDGTRFWANVIITALRDETGTLRGFGKVTRDLTARRAAEQAFRRSEQRFHHLVDSVIDYAIFMLDEAGNVASWNPGAQRVKGYQDHEIIGRHFSTFYTEEDRASGKPQAVLDAVRRAGRYEDESWRVRKDGTRFWANVVISALRDEQGQLVGFAKVTRDLSERRAADEALRHSNERFRLLVENVTDYAIYMLDPEGKVTTWNPGAQRMKGYDAAEVLGQSFERFWAPEDVAAGKPAQQLAVARASGRAEDEGWRVRKDGSRFWANAILTAVNDEQGALVGFAKITRDLTGRREAQERDRRLLREQTAREVAERSEAKLRESEERYRSLSKRLEIVLEGVADGITVQDKSGRLVFANTAAARICGFESGPELMSTPPAEVVARFEILDEAGRPLSVESLPARRVLAGEHVDSALIQVRERKTNRDWWVKLRASAVLGPSGTPELAINIWHDVTNERRQELQAKYLTEANGALASSLVTDEMMATFARALVPGLADCCSIYLLEGDDLRDVVTVHTAVDNSAAAQGYLQLPPPGAPRSGPLWSVIESGSSQVFNDIGGLTGNSPQAEAPELLQAAGTSGALIVPIRVRSQVLGALALVHTQGGRRYDAADVALMEELGRRAGVAVENAQLYGSAQRALQAAERAAEKAAAAARSAEEASRAKDEFLATVSHELRTPLNAILGWSSLLKARDVEPNLAKPIEVIHRNARAQLQIIDDILDVSRVISGKFRLDLQPMDLIAVARDAIEVVRPSAEAKRLELRFTPEVEFCLLVGDAERLQQVVWNLLSNAVKFTEAGGSVELSVSHDQSRVKVVVRDTGRGIEPGFLPFVFERFTQADASTTRRIGGLGLGLSLVRHIVELHGGQATAASEGAGRGAAFTITLPVRATIPVASPLSSKPSSGPPAPRVAATVLDGLRILVVDDEVDARQLVAHVLCESGALVEVADCVPAGFDTFKRFRPDVLVSDIGMPDEDGYSLIRRIRALPAVEGGRIPALALTAFAREQDRSRSLSAGFTTHIGKPVDPDALVAAVGNLAGIRHRQP